MYHNHEMAGHLGELETYNGIRQNYWWPGLWTFVKNYVQGCGICQQFKINRSLSNPAYIAIEGANNTRPSAKCSMDLITDLPLVEGYDSILAVVALWTPLQMNNPKISGEVTQSSIFLMNTG
jgi:hypothetical protein